MIHVCACIRESVSLSVQKTGRILFVGLHPNCFTYLHILGASRLIITVDVQHTFSFDDGPFPDSATKGHIKYQISLNFKLT